ncbi:MAG: hypothetical protein DI537_10265 [Stutzerimonas stutzeri]|nr:MAG: hypothetical protein DI537_10265 [Stutzerimonas stutzeri]
MTKGRPPKPLKSEEPFLLAVGDQFRFGPGTRIRAQDNQSEGFNPGDQVYLVVGTAMTGGGTGHGLHDVYPDGHEVRAVPVGTPAEEIGTRFVRFYQSGSFASDLMPPPVILLKRNAGEVVELWAGEE